jgi:hypothetical protein
VLLPPTAAADLSARPALALHGLPAKRIPEQAGRGSAAAP